MEAPKGFKFALIPINDEKDHVTKNVEESSSNIFCKMVSCELKARRNSKGFCDKHWNETKTCKQRHCSSKRTSNKDYCFTHFVKWEKDHRGPNEWEKIRCNAKECLNVMLRDGYCRKHKNYVEEEKEKKEKGDDKDRILYYI